MQKIYYVYILKCADASYYTGVTNDLERRLMEHKEGFNKTSFTYTRRPILLVYQESFTDVRLAIEREKQLKGWTREKKVSLIREMYEHLKILSRSNWNINKNKNEGEN